MVAFKIHVYDASLFEETPNRSNSEIWKSFLSSTSQKMKFPVKDFFSKCDEIRKKLRIWSHLLKNSLVENFIF